MLTNEDLKWIGVDFDKTIAQNDENFTPLEPLEGARETLLELEAQGLKIIVFSARPWTDYQMIEDWLNNYDIPFRRIICGKPLFKYVIDDRNIEFKNWAQVKEDIKWREIDSRAK